MDAEREAAAVRLQKRARERLGLPQPGAPGSVDWTALAAKLPAPHETAQSDALFEYLDSGGGHQQGNGALTLEQVDQGVLVTLGVDDAFGLQVCSPAVARAFATAKAVAGSAAGETVGRKEFGLALAHVRRYLEMFVLFDCPDGDVDNKCAPRAAPRAAPGPPPASPPRSPPRAAASPTPAAAPPPPRMPPRPPSSSPPPSSPQILQRGRVCARPPAARAVGRDRHRS